MQILQQCLIHLDKKKMNILIYFYNINARFVQPFKGIIYIYMDILGHGKYFSGVKWSELKSIEMKNAFVDMQQCS